MSKETELLKRLERFETRITLDASDDNIIDNAIRQNEKVVFYLSSLSAQTTSFGYGGSRIVLNVQYQNTDVPQDEIYVISSGEEVNGILCQFIGNYKSRLVLFADKAVDIDAEYHRFVAVNAPFYPNLVGAKISKGQTSVSSKIFYDFSFDYRIGKVKLAMMENEISAEVKKIANQLFLPSMNAATKAFLAHNYLAYSIDYTLKADASNLEKSYMQSAYGALIKKQCVCQGYAEAFKRLMDYAGVPCDIVCGHVKGSSDNHAWNIIKLNDGQDNYHVDVTWDSRGRRVAYEYFGLKDADLAGNRTWNLKFNAKCNSAKNLLLEARRGIMVFKSKLIAGGASPQILGF